MRLIPPDINGAAGPQHLLVTVNGTVAIQSRTGATQLSMTLQDFFGNEIRQGQFIFDPRVLYDAYRQRWYVAACCGNTDSTSALLLAVSATADPAADWFMYRMPAGNGQTPAVWFDYPSMGYNKNWIVVSGNMYTNAGAFSRVHVYAFNKEAVLSGTSGCRVFSVNDGTFCHAPAVTHDSLTGTLHCITDWNYTNGTTRLYRMTGTGASPAYTATNLFPSTGQGYGTSGPDAPQAGGTALIATNDSRFQGLVYRNGALFATHSVFLSSPARVGVEWFQIDPADASTDQFVRLNDPSGQFHYAFPSINVNRVNDVALGFSRFSASQYASAAYSLHSGSDPASFQRSIVQFKDGEDYYLKTFGGAKNRWGDYTSVSVDPLDDTGFWTLQEYAMSRTAYGNNPSYSRWGAWWAEVRPPVVSVTSGNWHNPSTWNCNCVPAATDEVEIAASHVVTVSEATAYARKLYYRQDGTIHIEGRGLLQVGN